jgi:hypothetical protein
MSSLQDGGVVDCFVAAHPEAEGVADEDLLGAFTFRELLNHLDGVGDFAVDGGVAGIDDLARGVDGFVEFGRAFSVRRPAADAIAETCCRPYAFRCNSQRDELLTKTRESTQAAFREVFKSRWIKG